MSMAECQEMLQACSLTLIELCYPVRHDTYICCLQNLVWIDGKIIFCTSLEYCIFDPGSGGVQSLFFLQEDAISRTIIAQLPGAEKALLSMASNRTNSAINKSKLCHSSTLLPFEHILLMKNVYWNIRRTTWGL